MDLVDDHGAHRPEHLAAPLRGEEEVERLGRGDQDVRRALEHRGPLRSRRVTGPDRGGDLDRIEPHGLGHLADLAPGLGQVLVDVGAQRLERRDVHHPNLVRQPALEPLAEQLVEGTQEGSQRLARARGCRDQGVPLLANSLPTPGLGGGRLTEPVGEPSGDGGVEVAQGHAKKYGGARGRAVR